jgi:hypothetical protein
VAFNGLWSAVDDRRRGYGGDHHQARGSPRRCDHTRSVTLLILITKTLGR